MGKLSKTKQKHAGLRALLSLAFAILRSIITPSIPSNQKTYLLQQKPKRMPSLRIQQPLIRSRYLHFC